MVRYYLLEGGAIMVIDMNKNMLIALKKLTRSQFILYVYMCSISVDGYAKVKYIEVEESIHICERTTIVALEKLRKTGLVTRIIRGEYQVKQL